MIRMVCLLRLFPHSWISHSGSNNAKLLFVLGPLSSIGIVQADLGKLLSTLPFLRPLRTTNGHFPIWPQKRLTDFPYLQIHPQNLTTTLILFHPPARGRKYICESGRSLGYSSTKKSSGQQVQCCFTILLSRVIRGFCFLGRRLKGRFKGQFKERGKRVTAIGCSNSIIWHGRQCWQCLKITRNGALDEDTKLRQ